MKHFSLFFLLLVYLNTQGQDTTIKKNESLFTFSGYIDLYYQFDFNKPANNERPSFLYNFKKHNQPSVNLAMLKVSYLQKKWKANLAIMAGDYTEYNLAAEPAFFRHINEANIGYAFSKKFSVNAGILPSHIGIESAIAKDNWNLSRSMLAENTPYYETGVKFNHTPNEKWLFSLLIINGWQNIKDYNSSKAIGTQLQFRPNDKLLINSSTFFGNERPDSVRQMRLFHNFYLSYAIHPKIKLAFLLDAGAERKINKDGYNSWMGAAILLQYLPAKNLNIAGRVEFYKDKENTIVTSYPPGKLSVAGFAFNIDYSLSKNLLFRNEARLFNSVNNIFENKNITSRTNFCLLSCISISF